MAAEQSFGNLLRNSSFARFSRKIPQTYARKAIGVEEKDLTFGMKREFCNKYWGERLQYVRVFELDGDYGFPTFVKTEGRVTQLEAWKELYYKFGTTNPQPVFSSVSTTVSPEFESPVSLSDSPQLTKNASIYMTKFYPSSNSKIIGRLLNRVQDGYAVGIGGLIAFLPFSEIPKHTEISHLDLIKKAAFEFYVKHVEMKPKMEPYIVLSCKSRE